MAEFRPLEFRTPLRCTNLPLQIDYAAIAVALDYVPDRKSCLSYRQMWTDASVALVCAIVVPSKTDAFSTVASKLDPSKMAPPESAPAKVDPSKTVQAKLDRPLAHWSAPTKVDPSKIVEGKLPQTVNDNPLVFFFSPKYGGNEDDILHPMYDLEILLGRSRVVVVYDLDRTYGSLRSPYQLPPAEQIKPYGLTEQRIMYLQFITYAIKQRIFHEHGPDQKNVPWSQFCELNFTKKDKELDEQDWTKLWWDGHKSKVRDDMARHVMLLLSSFYSITGAGRPARESCFRSTLWGEYVAPGKVVIRRSTQVTSRVALSRPPCLVTE